MRPLLVRSAIVTLAVLLLLPLFVGSATAVPEGTLTWGVHVTLAARWLDPSDTEAFITPFGFRPFYALPQRPSCLSTALRQGRHRTGSHGRQPSDDR